MNNSTQFTVLPRWSAASVQMHLTILVTKVVHTYTYFKLFPGSPNLYQWLSLIALQSTASCHQFHSPVMQPLHLHGHGPCASVHREWSVHTSARRLFTSVTKLFISFRSFCLSPFSCNRPFPQQIIRMYVEVPKQIGSSVLGWVHSLLRSWHFPTHCCPGPPQSAPCHHPPWLVWSPGDGKDSMENSNTKYVHSTTQLCDPCLHHPSPHKCRTSQLLQLRMYACLNFV